jgi:iron complex outermembrane receptor protein
MTKPQLLRTLFICPFFLLFFFSLHAQNKTITGKVTDESGAAIAGASVMVKENTSIGTTTDENGNFSLVVPTNTTALIISFVGYTSQEVNISNTTSVNVSLVSESASLSDVVVIGYGTARRSELTSSITRVTPKDFNQGPVQTVDQVLQGRVPGLSITRPGSDPNGTPTITLRGPGSLVGSSAPFYVIDGIPGASIELVAPADIISVDVLKDASATAIYGTRGANGVIVVTTRRAKAGESFVNYNGLVGVETIAKKIEMADAQQLDAYAHLFGGSGIPAGQNDGSNTDWMDEITDESITHSHNISFGGGTEKARYIASVNYYNQQGVLKNTNIDRLIGRLGADFSHFNNRLRFSLQLTESVINNRYPQSTSGEFGNPLFMALRYSPTLSPYNPDGSFKELEAPPYNFFNPLAMIEGYHDDRDGTIFQAFAKAGVDIFKDLSYDITLSYQKDQGDGKVYVDDNYPTGLYSRLFLPDGLPNTLFTARRYYNTTENKLIEMYFTYKHNFKDFNLNAIAGYSWQNIRSDGFGAGTVNVINPTALGANNLLLSNPPAGYNGITGSQIDIDRLISFFGRVELNFLNRYLITGSFRRDGSNKFGVNNRWGNFPSVGVGWRIINENFMKGTNTFTDLKLRASYGTSGEKNLPPYVSVLQYNTTYGSFYYQGDYISAVGVNRDYNPNPNLKWQTTEVVNIGIDFGFKFWGLNGSVDVYNKTSKDLLFNYTVPIGTTGPGGIRTSNKEYANIGKVRNRGIEVILNATPIKSKNFTWTSTANFAYNKNKIISLAGGEYRADSIQYGQIGGQGLSNEYTQILTTGGTIGQFFLYDFARSDEQGKQYYYDHTGKEVGSSQISSTTDQKIIGTAIPKINVGWANTFTLGKFDLSVFVRGQFGNKIMNLTYMNLDRDPPFAATYNVPVQTINNPISEQPRPSTKYLENGNFVRIDNATLGYSIPRFVDVLKSARIYFTVQNIATITDYSGIDPELKLSGDNGAIDAGRDFGLYPKTRVFTLGLNVGF